VWFHAFCRQPLDEELALKELETFMDKRIESAKSGQVSRRTVGEILQEVSKETQP
jgi:Antitoxin ParD